MLNKLIKLALIAVPFAAWTAFAAAPNGVMLNVDPTTGQILGPTNVYWALSTNSVLSNAIARVAMGVSGTNGSSQSGVNNLSAAVTNQWKIDATNAVKGLALTNNQTGVNLAGSFAGDGSGVTNASVGLGYRTFYVATDGNNTTAKINNEKFPFAPIFDGSAGTVCALANQPGDVIRVMPGNYTVTNVVLASQGVTLQGVGLPVFLPQPFFNDVGYSTFQLKDNCKIIGIAWGGTNGYQDVVGGAGIFHSFALSGPTVTNVVISDCLLMAGSDTFFSTNLAQSKITVQNCKIDATHGWDFFAGVNAIVTSIGNLYIGNSNNVSKINVSPGMFSDFGSFFETSTGGITCPSPVSVNGSSIHLGPRSVSGFFAGRFNCGDYMLVDDGLLYSAGPDGGKYATNSVTTTTQNHYSATNITATSASVSSAANQTYYLYSASGVDVNFATGTATWTNAVNGYQITLNDPAVVSLLGLGPENNWGVKNPGGTYEYADQVTLLGDGGDDLLGINPNSIHIAPLFYTTSIYTTNYVNAVLAGAVTAPTVGIQVNTNLFFTSSAWPPGANWAGQSCLWNSNSSATYLLSSKSSSTNWARTNYIGGFDASHP